MGNGKKSTTLTIGWVLLFILGLLMAAGGVASLLTAYRATDDPIVEGVALERLAEIHPDIPNALRGRRATASCLAISYGILLGWISVTAYKRGERWAWFALLTSLGVGSVLSLLRGPVLGWTPGTAGAVITLAILLVALLISYRDFK